MLIIICIELKLWSRQTGLGDAATTPGIIFTDTDNVIPDVIWVSHQRLAQLLDDAGHLVGASELVVEVLSSGEEQQKRDRQLKLKLYSIQGVQEYWIIDRQKQQIEIYRRDNAVLKLTATLYKEDDLNNPLLPGFNCSIAQIFA
ncbi:Uma2 family endonuclease [Gloeocapsopsis crepidinum]|uniref:Uma2 family endonuclease n=1 Tax=Gloeocapsopsis crepidinum TaxID=693223 RepID=UPI002AD23718|nr:Uma2 family endonuclease [Gloeocapsopsis crepidinum]